jgi:hypothetical protein
VWLLLLQTQLRLLPVGLDAGEQFAQAGANALTNPLSGLTDFSACAFLVTSIGFVAWIAVKTFTVIGAFPGHRKHALAVAKAQRVFDAAKDMPREWVAANDCSPIFRHRCWKHLDATFSVGVRGLRTVYHDPQQCDT